MVTIDNAGQTLPKCNFSPFLFIAQLGALIDVFSHCLRLMLLWLSLAFISPLGKVISLKYAHGTRSDPFNDENALKKQIPDFGP